MLGLICPPLSAPPVCARMENNLKKPRSVYKYEPMSIQALANLKSETIYFNSPLNFNDPFDCNMGLEVSAPYIDEIPFIRDFLLEETKGTAGEAKIKGMSEGEIAAMGLVTRVRHQILVFHGFRLPVHCKSMT